jgi:hypothetical protein
MVDLTAAIIAVGAAIDELESVEYPRGFQGTVDEILCDLRDMKTRLRHEAMTEPHE